MTIVYTANQDRLVLDDADLVGSGGEGSVFKDPKNPRGLIKVYENPTREHGQKLIDFLSHKFHLPKNVAAPTEVVYNSHHSIIGFRMPFFKGAQPFRKLSDKKYCLSEKIGAKQIIGLHLQKLDLLNSIHSQGIAEGDLNDLNNLFKNDQTISIDVDSWQFANWTCGVATENFLNPRLYGVDLSQKPCFTSMDDWYSFAVMLHKGLLKVHPYGGTHPTVKNLPNRAIKHLTVHDKGVIYPAVGLSQEVISDDLSEVFHRFFKLGKIDTFPKQIIEKFQKDLVVCPSCQQEYPRNRRVCPTCKEQNKATLNITVPGSVTYQQMFAITGNIVYHKLENQKTLLVIAVEKNFATLYIIDLFNTRTIPLFAYQKGTRFEVSTKILVTNDGQSENLNVYNIVSDHLDLVGQLVTDVYAGNNQAVFHVNGEHLFRIIGSQLVDTTIYNNQFLNQTLRQVIAHQTWFSSNSDSEYICVGFHRVLRQQFLWLSKEKFATDVKLPSLETGEGLLDISIKYSHGNILVVRKTKLKGKEYVRLDHLDDRGNILSSAQYDSASLPDDDIHEFGFSKDSLIFPTDQGAVRLKLSDQSLANFTSTNKLINTTHSLYFFQKGLLVVGEKSVHYLTQN